MMKNTATNILETPVQWQVSRWLTRMSRVGILRLRAWGRVGHRVGMSCLVRLNAIVLSRVLGHLWCGLWIHEYILDTSDRSISRMVCGKCGHKTHGWEVGGTRPGARGGARLHAMIKPARHRKEPAVSGPPDRQKRILAATCRTNSRESDSGVILRSSLARRQSFKAARMPARTIAATKTVADVQLRRVTASLRSDG